MNKHWKTPALLTTAIAAVISIIAVLTRKEDTPVIPTAIVKNDEEQAEQPNRREDAADFTKESLKKGDLKKAARGIRSYLSNLFDSYEETHTIELTDSDGKKIATIQVFENSAASSAVSHLHIQEEDGIIVRWDGEVLPNPMRTPTTKQEKEYDLRTSKIVFIQNSREAASISIDPIKGDAITIQQNNKEETVGMSIIRQIYLNHRIRLTPLTEEYTSQIEAFKIEQVWDTGTPVHKIAKESWQLSIELRNALDTSDTTRPR